MDGGQIVLLDLEAAAVVLAGTFVASILAHGWNNCSLALRRAAGLVRPSLDEPGNRAALARVLYLIKRDGRFRTEAVLPLDPALAAMVTAYLRLGEIAPIRAAVEARHEEARTERRRAVGAWRAAGELAPVAGLAGTLYAITGLIPDLGVGLAEATAEAIATAAVSTLYGLALAHLVCLPLAGGIARRSLAEEATRDRLACWFEAQLPPLRSPGPAQPPAPVLVEAA